MIFRIIKLLIIIVIFLGGFLFLRLQLNYSLLVKSAPAAEESWGPPLFPTPEESWGPPLPPTPTPEESWGPPLPPASESNTTGGSSGSGGSTLESGSVIENEAAPNPSPIRNALDTTANSGNEWVITAWKVVLGLADLGLVLVLIFLIMVNILHIQYDTYAIKKVLPTLIIGIILANFSLLIIRMLLDFANILTMVFTNSGPPADFAKNFVSQAGTTIGAKNWGGLGILFLMFLLSIYVMVAFLILGFLFYVRYVVIIVCAIAAPLAFVAMAFPPTQQYFKQWWGWLSKYIFMKPIAFFFLWLAKSILGTGALNHITGWFIVATLIYIAIIIPFKLGGAVMAGWGKAGQWLTGTKAGGYLKKPLDTYIQSKKDAWKERANLGAEKYLGLAQRRQRHALTMERLKNERTRLADESQVKLRAKLGQKLGKEKAKQARAKKDVEDIDLINDILDREDRGNERTKNELRDRTIAATHNAVTKKWMHKMFENSKVEKVGATWEPFISGAGKYIGGGEEKSDYQGRNFSEVLGRLEGRSGEMDRAIESVNATAMLRIAHEHTGTYYDDIANELINPDSIDPATGQPRKMTREEVEQKFIHLTTRIAERQQELSFLDPHRDKAEFERVSGELSTDIVEGTKMFENLKNVTVTDQDGNVTRKFSDEEIDKLKRLVRLRNTKFPEKPAPTTPPPIG